MTAPTDTDLGEAERSEQGEPGSPEKPEPTLWQRIVGGVTVLPDPIRQRQPCVSELFAYSADGDYTTADPASSTEEGRSPQRRLHFAYMCVVAAPITVLCDVIKYAVARPERCAFAVLTVAAFALGMWLLVL